MTRWLTACGVALLLAAGAVAQGGGVAAPDPVRLSADWWTYFTPAEDDEGPPLEARIDAATAVLDALREQLPDDTGDDVIALIETVDAKLQRFGEFAAMALPQPNPVIVALDAYTLTDLRELVEDLRRVTVDRNAEAADIRALERALASTESEQSQRKVAYLALDPAAPQRLQRGLELMQTRLQLELGKRELVFRKAHLEHLEGELAHLQELLEAAASRLVAEDEALARVLADRERAQERAAELRSRLAQLELAQNSVLAVSPQEQARAQLQMQRGLTLEAQALTEELRAAQLGIAEVLLRRAAADNSQDPGPHRSALRDFRDALEATRERRGQISAATLRSRATAIGRVAAEDDGEVVRLLRERLSAADDTESQVAALDERLSVAEQFGVLLGKQLVGAEGRVGATIQLLKGWSDDGWDSVVELASLSLFEISETPVTVLGILRMLLIMTMAWWISKLARKGLMSVAARRETINHGSVYTLGRILHYTILLLGVMVALSSIGIDFTKFALFASALGVGIGFGLQTLVSNFVAGLIILFEKSLKVGDFVELESGVTGEVKEINMRSTLVTTNDNIDIVVPNSEFVNSRVTNWTMREAYRRVHIPFGVAYGTDKELVRKAALEAAAEIDLTLTGHRRREPQVWFVEFGDSSLNFELVLWLQPDAVKRPAAVNATYLWAIDDKLRKYHIEVPFPQRDLHLRSAFGLKDDDGRALLARRGDGGAGNATGD